MYTVSHKNGLHVGFAITLSYFDHIDNIWYSACITHAFITLITLKARPVEEWRSLTSRSMIRQPKRGVHVQGSVFKKEKDTEHQL